MVLKSKPSSRMPALRRVALFLHALTEGGAQRRTLALAESLSLRGLTVDLLVADDEGPLREMLPQSVDLHVVGKPLAMLPWVRSNRGRQVRASIFGLAHYLRRARPDVLVSAANHTALATVKAHRLSQCQDIALVLRVSNALTSRKRLNQGRRSLGMQRALRHVDAVAAVSQALACEVKQLCTAPSPEIRTVLNPVIDPVLLASAERTSPAWDDDGRPVILGLGRLVKQKDFATLIRAFALLPDARALRLVILGEGPERASLQALAQSLGIADCVSLPGRVANPFASLRAARLFVLSSQWEGMPGSLIEAMACGCPVISTDCAGAREALLDGSLAPMVPIGDAEAMAKAIAAALDRSIDPAPLIRRAMDFSFEPAAKDFVSVLELARQRRHMHKRFR